MKMRKYLAIYWVSKVCFFAGLIFIITTIITTITRADQEGGVIPYLLESQNKKYVFVMLKGGSPDSPHSAYSPIYTQSGLYRNDGSAQPLWVIDWSAQVFLPSDGIHLVRKGKWARIGDYDEEAITFFAQGKPVKMYRVRDLVDFPYFLPRTVSHFEWQKTDATSPVKVKMLDGAELPFQTGVSFDELTHTMKLETLQGDRYVFNVETGEIISSYRPVRRILVIIGTIIILLIVASIFYFLRRKKKMTGSD